MKSDRCLGTRDTSNIKMMGSHISLLGSETFAYLSFFLLEALQMQMKIWYLDQDTYEFNTVFYYRLVYNRNNYRNGYNHCLITERALTCLFSAQHAKRNQ